MPRIQQSLPHLFFSDAATHQGIDTSDKISLLRLARTENVGPIAFFHLLKKYRSAQESLRQLPTLTQRNPARIPSVEEAEREFRAHEKQGFQLLSYYDEAYPPLLKQLKDAPPFLSVCGDLNLLQRTLFSIVGARNASLAGERMASEIAGSLSEMGWCLVSGLAKGIDTCVHRASLERGTVAVIAGGLGNIYPLENKKLYHSIAEGGLILAEDALGKAPAANLFPKRNRLISGISWGLMVMEAGLKSGSLITAKYALEQGKAIFSVPGHPMDVRSRGSNQLLKQGAYLVETHQDILETYALSYSHMKEDAYDYDFHMEDIPLPTDYEKLHRDIQKALTFTPVAVNDLARHLAVSPIVLRIALIDMELNGEIQRYPGDIIVPIK